MWSYGGHQCWGRITKCRPVLNTVAAFEQGVRRRLDRATPPVTGFRSVTRNYSMSRATVLKMSANSAKEERVSERDIWLAKMTEGPLQYSHLLRQTRVVYRRPLSNPDPQGTVSSMLLCQSADTQNYASLYPHVYMRSLNSAFAPRLYIYIIHNCTSWPFFQCPVKSCP